MKKIFIIFLTFFIISCGNNIEENKSEKLEKEVTETEDKIEKTGNVLIKNGIEIYDKNGEKFFENSRGKYILSIKNDNTFHESFILSENVNDKSEFYFNSLTLSFKELKNNDYYLQIENGNFLNRNSKETFEEYVDFYFSKDSLKESIKFQGFDAYKIYFKRNDRREYNYIIVNLGNNEYLRIELGNTLENKNDDFVKKLQEIVDNIKIKN